MRSLLFLAIVLLSEPAAAFESFNEESARMTRNIGCLKPRISPAEADYGALYTCITGTAMTVKMFINQRPASNSVLNVKFMWNDYTRDTGSGLHTDAKLARAWAAALGTMYAPKQVEEVMNVFMGKRSGTLRSEGYVLTYTYDPGPAIGEHMMIVTQKK